MSIFDLLSAGNESESAGQEPPPGLAALLGTLSGQTPTATTPASGTGLPPASPVDNSMLVPLMLMRAAAEVSQRRAPGQSKTNQNLTALYNSALAGMAYKGDQEDRAQKARKLQLDETVTSQNLSAAQQQQAQAAELHPLKVMAARLGITEGEAKVKVEAAKAKYAEEYEKARIESQNATTAAQRAIADKRLADIEAGQRKLDLLLTGQQIQGQRMNLQAEQLEARRQQMENADIKVHFDQTTGRRVDTWRAGGDQYVRTHGMGEIEAEKYVTRLLDARKATAERLGQAFKVTPEMYAAEMRKLTRTVTERRGPDGNLVEVPDGAVPQPGQPAPAPKSTAGTNNMASEPPPPGELDKLIAKLSSDPPGTIRKDSKGGMWVLSPTGIGNGKAHITRASPEQIRASSGAAAGATDSGDLSKATPAQLWKAYGGNDPLQKKFALEELRKRGLVKDQAAEEAPTARGSGRIDPGY